MFQPKTITYLKNKKSVRLNQKLPMSCKRPALTSSKIQCAVKTLFCAYRTVSQPYPNLQYPNALYPNLPYRIPTATVLYPNRTRTYSTRTYCIRTYRTVSQPQPYRNATKLNRESYRKRYFCVTGPNMHQHGTVSNHGSVYLRSQ